MNIYYDPEKFGLETIGEIEWSSGSYEFDLTVVWRFADGRFLFGEDSGCSCPLPFDSFGIDNLTPITSLAEFQRLLGERNTEQHTYCPDRSNEIAELLERLHAAGVR